MWECPMVDSACRKKIILWFVCGYAFLTQSKQDIIKMRASQCAAKVTIPRVIVIALLIALFSELINSSSNSTSIIAIQGSCLILFLTIFMVFFCPCRRRNRPALARPLLAPEPPVAPPPIVRQPENPMNFASFSYHDGENTCVVCLQGFENGKGKAMLLKCGHIFHSECIKDWGRKHDSCPICRQ